MSTYGPGLGFRIHAGIRFVEHHVFQVNGQFAALGHGVARVDTEIQQDLVELGRVAGDGPEVVGGMKFKLHRFGKGFVNDLLDFADDVFGLDRDAFAGDAAPEGQHLFDETCAALHVGFQGVQQFLPVGVGDFFLEQLDGDEERRQHVVEVVGDAAGQGAEAFHALGAQELGFQFFLFGDVGVDDQAWTWAGPVRRR